MKKIANIILDFLIKWGEHKAKRIKKDSFYGYY